LGAKYLVVLCAGSALLLVKDALTSIVNNALAGVSLGLQASPSGVWLFHGYDKPWFLNEGKFATVLIIPSSWGSQMNGDLHQHRAASASKLEVEQRRCRDAWQSLPCAKISWWQTRHPVSMMHPKEDVNFMATRADVSFFSSPPWPPCLLAKQVGYAKLLVLP
jgi:hypothetical protein